MGNVIRQEIKYSIWNLCFPCGVLLILLAALAAGRPFAQQIQEAQGAVEGPGWFAVYAYCTSAANMLLFIPIAVPLASGSAAEMELHSRYYLFSCSRSGKKSYLLGKVVRSVVSGGLMSCLGMLLLLVALVIWVGSIPALGGGGPNAAEMAGAVAAGFLRFFFNGALWALVGSLAAVVTRNRYLAYAVPFILYYVLTAFQERYYNTLFFLSPRYWVAPVYYGNLFCIPVLLVCCTLVALFLMTAIKRRVEHA